MKSLSEEFHTVYNSDLVSRRWLSEKVFEVELIRPPSFHFEPGSVVKILHENACRCFALVSSIFDPTITFCVRYVQEDMVCNLLAFSPRGASVRFTGPLGYFVLKPSPQPTVLVATDTGIAPFVSMIRSGITDFTVLHGGRSVEDLYYKDSFAGGGCSYVPCVSDVSDFGNLPEAIFQGTVKDYMKSHLPRRAYDFYLSGCRGMVREVIHLIDEEFPDSRVFREFFCCH
jgi:benzoate/toluate 1,2-dioxygenase reductase component